MFETYAQEMKRKFPDRPYVTWQSVYLRNMVRALSLMPWLNTPEENERKFQAEMELKARRKEGRK